MCHNFVQQWKILAELWDTAQRVLYNQIMMSIVCTMLKLGIEKSMTAQIE